MTLGRLIELYTAEQQGKQIMLTEYCCGFFETSERITEVKISECDLSLFIENTGTPFRYTFFIKDEEDEYGNKVTRT